MERKRKADFADGAEDELEIKVKSKNAPAEMRSDKPTRRLRISADNSVQKFRDPRFSDISGKLDYNHFTKNYSFLDQYQKNEIEKLSKAMKSVKDETKYGEIKNEVIKMKQQVKERTRYQKYHDKLLEVKHEEIEKVEKGKNPFFLKKSMKKDIQLDIRYQELKKEGKLNKYLEKKRKHNSAKDRKWMPIRIKD